MKILHLNTYDIFGGAARTTHKIHRQMLHDGYDSKMLVLYKKSNEAEIIKIELKKNFFYRQIYRIKINKNKKDLLRYSTNLRDTPFHDDRSYITSEIDKDIKGSDIINLHWVAGFIDYRSFFSRYAGKIPIVWRLADMNPFTGGCHYDWDCGRYSEGCGSCPQLGSNDKNDLSNQIWERKNNTLQKISSDRLHIVTLSEWMNRKIKLCPLFSKFPRTIIRNGVDLNIFRPKDKILIRKKLGIATRKKILLFAAENISVQRKGFKILVEAISALQNKESCVLVTVGNNKMIEYPALDEHYHFNATNNKNELANIYNAADIFIIPSLQENFPNTVLESMACGIPVIGFPVGGIPEIIENGKNGYITEEITPRALHNSIKKALLNSNRLKEMGYYAVEKTKKEYNIMNQISKYITLYNTLIKQTL